MKKTTKKKIVIISVTIILYLVYLFSDIPSIGFVPTALLLFMFLGLGLVKYNQI